ncbi:hypothetical protein Taro_026391 [Colocasia esculenta]|uniref:Uncharacterized protein n=1 Tax=Colocasia esculenta TaxID=4460 RepID=A0A843VCS8_COLES|nr:hypothetical protein [Colocasia esculenta]
MGGDATFGAPGGGPGGRVVTVVCGFPARVVRVLQLLLRRVRVHAVVVQLVVDSLAVVFPYGGRLQASPGAVLLVVFGAFECVCVPKAERAYVWCGLHWCKVVFCGTDRGFSRTVLCSFLVAVALPSRPRCIAWLPYVLVRFPRTVCCCPGEHFSQDCFVLAFVVAVLPQSLRCAVGLAGAFWRVFPERCLGGSSGGSPKTCLHCFCSSTCCSVLSDSLCCLVVGLCILVKVLPKIALCRSWWRFSPKLLLVVLVVAALSLCRDELPMLLVGLSVLQSAWALSSRCSVFCALLGANVVVALWKLSAFCVLLLWVSGGESPSVGPMSSQAVGADACAAP